MLTQAIMGPVADELSSLEDQIKNETQTDVPLISQVISYIVGSGGKRLRPLVLILMSKALGYNGSHSINLATALEFIHTATLLHDDVVDTSSHRRGKKSAHINWNNSTSILVGDFLYSKAFQLLVLSEDLSILRLFADGTNCIAEGETRQLMNRHQLAISEQQYLEILQDKTGKLFEIAAEVGVMLGTKEYTKIQTLKSYGRHLGLAFQLIDDVLDYTGNLETIGKNVGDDLAKGSPTLPLLYTYWHGSEEEKTLVREAIVNGTLDHLADINQAIKRVGALDYTTQLASKHIDTAIESLSVLPDSPYKEALQALAQFAVNRSF